MFHVKQNSNQEVFEWQSLWAEGSTPYDPAVWQEKQAPWELLEKTTFSKLLESQQNRANHYQLPFSGFLSSGYLIHEEQVLKIEDPGALKVEGAASVSKGKMRCYWNGGELVGASWIQAGAFIGTSGPIVVGPGSLIQSGAYVDGPTVLGPSNEVRQGAYLRGNVLAGKSCIFGHTSECKGAIFHDHAKAPHFAYVGDSILGASVNLGAGTKISNLKITGTNITLSYNGKSYATNMRKLGAILGDNVETGCNSVLNPGVILGQQCGVYPAVAVSSGIYAPKSWIRGPKDIKKLK